MCMPVGVREIAQRLGSTSSAISQCLHRGEMPDPRWVVSGRPAWDWPDVEVWAVERGRLVLVDGELVAPQRPHKAFAGGAYGEAVTRAIRRCAEVGGWPTMAAAYVDLEVSYHAGRGLLRTLCELGLLEASPGRNRSTVHTVTELGMQMLERGVKDGGRDELAS